jgi:restriction system protein
LFPREEMIGVSRFFLDFGDQMICGRVWAVRAGPNGQADSIFLGSDQIAISSAEVEADVSRLPASRGAFKEAFGRSANLRPEAVPIQAGQLFRFVHEMRIGDRIIYPRRFDRTLRWGEVVGPYVFDVESRDEYSHRRAVRWIARMSRDEFSQGVLYELGSLLALFEIKSFAAEFRRRFEGGEASEDAEDTPAVVEEDAEAAVLRDIGDTTRDFIARKIKTELKGFQFEPFVADLFRAMGYRARATRAVRDDGIDVIAHRDELGIEPPILKVQVKAHEANIGADCVKAFYAMVHDRDVGVFITSGGYSAGALDFARSKANLRLINGIELVDLIQKYYDSLDVTFRRAIPLRRVFVPDVAVEA